MNDSLMDFLRDSGIVVPIPNTPTEIPFSAVPIPNFPYPAYNVPIEAPTFNNAPPVGQAGKPEPLPFYKYAPPVGQDITNGRPQNFDTHLSLEGLPPVPQFSENGNIDNLLEYIVMLNNSRMNRI